MVKHLSIVEALYFGETFWRPIPEHLRWWDIVDDNASMWARRAWAHADATIDVLALDSPGPSDP